MIVATICPGPADGAATRTEGRFGFGISFQSPSVVRAQPVVPLMRRLVDGVDALLNDDEVRAFFP